MKILHIIPNLKKGGAERLVTDIVRELKKRSGIEVCLVLFRNEIEYDIEDIKDAVKVIPASVQLSLWKKNKLNTDQLQAFINNFQPDIIHSHLFEAEIVSRSCLFSKALWFSHFHDNMVQFENFSLKTIFNKTKLTNFFEKLTLFKNYKKNGGNTFIAISQDSFKYAKKTCGNYPVIYLPNAINYDKFYAPIRKEIKKIKIVNVGSFVSKKNQQFLVSIGMELAKRNLDFEIHFLGDGELKNRIEKEVNSLSLSKYFYFQGNVNEVENHLNNANIYVHTAIYEPFGLVLLEAMTAGLPVITLDGNGNRDLIEEGKNGYMIYDENLETFAYRIIELWNNKEMYLTMSKYAQEYAKQYDIKPYVDKLLVFYQSTKPERSEGKQRTTN